MKNMKYKNENNKLTIFFAGELNSANADTVEGECLDIISKNEFDSIVLDFNNLVYISSAGLRILLRLKQKYQKVEISQVSLEVYDILQMTGFTNIIACTKRLNEVSVENAQVIGEGFFSTVYRINKDTIIKVFNRTSDANQIERELKLAKTAFVLGIPTAISFDIVKVGDKLGVRFEMLDCMSLKNCFLSYPERYDELLGKYVNLLKKINSTECYDSSIPDMHKIYSQKVEAIKPYFTKEQYEKLVGLFDKLEHKNTFVHGDCHFKNIMVQGDGFLLIDMDTLSIGNPVFELAQLRAPYVAFDEDDPGNAERFLGVTSEFVNKLFLDVVKNYYGVDDEKIKQKLALICYTHMVWWTITNTPDNKKRFEGCKERLLKLLEVVEDLNIGDVNGK